MGRPTLPIKSPKRPGRRRSGSTGGGRLGSGSSSGLRGGGGAGGASGGAAANIKVAVRVRPENSRESAGNYKNVINVVDERMMIFDPKEEDDAFYFQGKKQAGHRDLNKKQAKDQKFFYDAVFAPGSTNVQVFEGTTKDLVDTIFQGYNCSVFAYGATGAGKTFTMLGAKDSPGITVMTMQEIYSKIDSVNDEKSCEIGLSYLEVYNETVIDLLSPGGQLSIREDGKKTSISGLSVHKPTGPEDILSLLSFGNGNRTQHATDANKESSRSHAVLQVFLKQKDKAAGLSAEVKVAKMSLIDLAGSEKGCVTGNKGVRFREGSNINKSLLALGNCINALADGSKYIPYRDSKLTRLLKDSIGGNCRTVMIANVSPSSETFEDTFNTLKYADRAKKIKINLKKNVLNVDFHVAQYAKIVEDLRSEIAVLKEKIRELEEENASLKDGGGGCGVVGGDNQDMQENTEVVSTSNADVLEENELKLDEMQATLNRYIERQRDYDLLQERVAEFERAQSANKTQKSPSLESKEPSSGGVEKGLEEENLEQLLAKHKEKVEKLGNESSSLADLKLRIHFKRQIHERAGKISVVSKDVEKSQIKTGKAVEALSKKAERKEVLVAGLVSEVAASRSLVEVAAVALGPQMVRLAGLEMELIESKTGARHMGLLVNTLGGKLDSLDTQLNSVSEMVKNKHKLLRGHDIISKADNQEFEELKDNLLEHRLTWATNLNEYQDDDCEVETTTSIYSEVARLNLASIDLPGRPRSVEQRVLFEETSVPNNATTENAVMNDREETVVTEIVKEVSGTIPIEETPTYFPALPPTPNLFRQAKLDLGSTFTPQAKDLGMTFTPLSCAPTTTSPPDLVPSTPQLVRQPSHPPSLKPVDLTFLKSPGVRLDVELSTPKRVAEEVPSPHSQSKRPRVETWAVHRETPSIPPTPVQIRDISNVTTTNSTAALNETFDSEIPGVVSSGGCSPDLGCTKLNETVTLVTKLGQQCELNSPSVKVAVVEPKNLNSTFAIEGEEPMDVDHTSYLKSLPSNLGPDMSVILPPSSSAPLSPRSNSPIKAGLGLVSPSNPNSSSSPLRQSTLLDMKVPARRGLSPAKGIPRRSPRNEGASVQLMVPPSKKGGVVAGPGSGVTPGPSSAKKGRGAGPRPSTTPQPVRRTLVKRNSVSTSVLPKLGSSQPVSFKSTIARVHPEQAEQQYKFMQGTHSSKLKQGGSLERRKKESSSVPMPLAKENPEIEAKNSKGGFLGVGNKLGNGLGKLKKSVSGSSVLRPNNKN